MQWKYNSSWILMIVTEIYSLNAYVLFTFDIPTDFERAKIKQKQSNCSKLAFKIYNTELQLQLHFILKLFYLSAT